MNNKLFLIFHGRFPSEKAASLFAAKSAEAFADQGLAVTLVVPKRRGLEVGDPYRYYDLKKNFVLRYIPVIDLSGFWIPKKISFWLSFVSFSVSCFWHARSSIAAADIIYSNESLPLLFISSIRRNCFYEMHDFPERGLGLFGRLLHRMRGTLIHNRWKLEETIRLFPHVDPKKFILELNAVDPISFDINLSKEEARIKLRLPAEKKVVMYTGHLYGWKGVHTLAEAATQLPKDFLTIFVGGTDPDINSFKNKYGNLQSILIAGRKKHSEIPFWQKAADVLVLPNTAKEKISAFYTSPMKLFEYMASKVPIVASKIPSIEGIVGSDEVFFAEPDAARSLATSIKNAVLSGHEGVVKAEKAYLKVLNHTWSKRAQRIVSFIQSKI